MTRPCLSMHSMAFVKLWLWRVESCYPSLYPRLVPSKNILPLTYSNKAPLIFYIQVPTFSWKFTVFSTNDFCRLYFSSSHHLSTPVRWPYCLQSQVIPWPVIWIRFCQQCWRRYKVALAPSTKKRFVKAAESEEISKTFYRDLLYMCFLFSVGAWRRVQLSAVCWGWCWRQDHYGWTNGSLQRSCPRHEKGEASVCCLRFVKLLMTRTRHTLPEAFA